MFILVNKNTFVSFLFLLKYLSAAPTAVNDGLCGKTRSNILCVKDILNEIAKSTKTIDHLTAKIEESIVQEFPLLDTLYNSVNHSLHSIQSELPASLYHDDFLRENNIDKEYFVDLMEESHYSVSVLYITLKDLIQKKVLYATHSPNFYEMILDNLKIHFICPYRSILDVYSREYPFIQQIKSLTINRRSQRDTMSLQRSSHSILMARLIHFWMKKIETVAANVERKLF